MTSLQGGMLVKMGQASKHNEFGDNIKNKKYFSSSNKLPAGRKDHL